MADLDRRSSTIVVRLKGARDEHRVPVTEEFWRLFDLYLEHERRDVPGAPAWVGLRRGWPNPLTYGAFEAGLRQLASRTGIEVTAHMFRHTVASGVEVRGIASDASFDGSCDRDVARGLGFRESLVVWCAEERRAA